jgi:hypothetical protein
MTDLPPYDHEPVTTPDGTPVIGWWPPPQPKCKCSHIRDSHGRDSKGRIACFSVVCGCIEFRPKESA